MKKAYYQVLNASGSLIKTFDTFKEATEFANSKNRCGLMYGLRVQKRFSKVTK